MNWWNDDVRGYLRWAQIIAEFKCQNRRCVGIFDGSFADLVAHERAFNSKLPVITPENVPSPYCVTFLCDSSEIDVEVTSIRETDLPLRDRLQLLVEEEAFRLSERVVPLSGDRKTRLDRATAVLEDILAAQRFE